MTHKKMDLVLDLTNEPEGSLEPLGSYLKEFQGNFMIDSYLERFRKVVMLMKKYAIRSSPTTIEALDGSVALPQETLEYFEIQPPTEAMLPWTDLDNEVSSWRRNQAVSPHQPFLDSNEFLSEKTRDGKLGFFKPCHYEADLDINAARNILLRFLTLNNIMFKRGSLGEASVSYAPTVSHSVPERVIYHIWEI